jgi:hypothetical protein
LHKTSLQLCKQIPSFSLITVPSTPSPYRNTTPKNHFPLENHFKLS